MPGSVRDIPGVRSGAQIFLFTGEDDEGIITRVEDFDADWLGVAAPQADEIGSQLSTGDPVEVELPLAAGSVFLLGTVTGRRTDGVPQVLIRVEEVGTDAGVGHSREARRHFRQTFWLPLRRLTYQTASGEWREAGGILRDVSGGGLSAFTDAPIPSGSTVRLDCPVPLEPYGLVAEGTVVGSRESGTEDRPRWIVNVRFDNLDRHERSWLLGQLHRYQWLVRWRSR